MHPNHLRAIAAITSRQRMLEAATIELWNRARQEWYEGTVSRREIAEITGVAIETAVSRMQKYSEMVADQLQIPHQPETRGPGHDSDVYLDVPLPFHRRSSDDL